MESRGTMLLFYRIRLVRPRRKGGKVEIAVDVKHMPEIFQYKTKPQTKEQIPRYRRGHGGITQQASLSQRGYQ